MSNQIRTLLRHERVLAPDERERGVRQWSAVQVLSPTWFFVESCDGDVQRWITTSIADAADIQRGLEPVRWARIFVCLFARQSIGQGTMFEEIEEAYQLGSSSSHLFQLANGMSFVAGTDSAQVADAEPKKLRLIYNRKTVRQRSFAS